MTSDVARATFAGGCFWCMEPPFRALAGVLAVRCGYTGGHSKDPDYRAVCSGTSGHAEAVEVVYDPAQVSYRQLLDIFWRNIDPTDGGGQFVDRGSQYRSAIFVHDAEQRRLAEESRAALAASGRFLRPIVTAIEAAAPFYPAEEYHQQYKEKEPGRYYCYLDGSRREYVLEKIWKEKT